MNHELKGFDLQEYLSNGIERVVKEALRATLKDPKESAFMLRFASATRAASKKRQKLEENGEHIPSFLIASITSECNLHCAGCYSRCNHATVDAAPVCQLTGDEWLRIFEEADELGVSFILLAGGEPMLRRDVIESAAKKPNILFPIFTNGTYMDEEYFELFDKNRNLLPILSIEGEKDITDKRRGEGMYDKQIVSVVRHRRWRVLKKRAWCMVWIPTALQKKSTKRSPRPRQLEHQTVLFRYDPVDFPAGAGRRNSWKQTHIMFKSSI